MPSDAGSDLKHRFDAAFAYPSGAHRLKSERGRATRINSEIWYVMLAGPLHSITETGGCAYVYARDDAYFSGVDDPVALRERLRDWHARLVEEIGDFVPTSPDEAIDLGSMRQSAADIWAVVEAAWAIEHDRWMADAGRAR